MSSRPIAHFPQESLSPTELDVTFFVPCYNEEANVVGAVQKVIRAASLLGLSHEVLVFDDASQDRTIEAVERFQKRNPQLPVRLFTTETNRGVSHNFVKGAFEARGEFYRLVCGDDVEPLETHLAILRERGSADIVIPYFTRIEGRKLHRHVISLLYTQFVNWASGNSLRYYNGCPLYRRYDVIRWHVEASGFGYQAEFLTRLLKEGKRYVEVPVTSIDREGSASLCLRNFLSVAHSLLKISLRRLGVYLFK